MVSRSNEPGRERLLLINWKPTLTWLAVANGYADSYLRSVAARIEAAYDRPFFLTLHAEMESDVNPTPGSGMTALDFRAFFRHTVQVLRANGADKVIPIVNYTGAPHWPYVEWWDDLYPGDDVVDWIAEDPYAFGQPPIWRSDFTGMVNRVQGPPSWPGFYEWVRRDHPDKPIMLAEWGRRRGQRRCELQGRVVLHHAGTVAGSAEDQGHRVLGPCRRTCRRRDANRLVDAVPPGVHRARPPAVPAPRGRGVSRPAGRPAMTAGRRLEGRADQRAATAFDAKGAVGCAAARLPVRPRPTVK